MWSPACAMFSTAKVSAAWPEASSSAAGPAFERRDALLDDRLGRVLDAVVDVAELGEGEQVLRVLGGVEDVRGRLVDGGRPRVGHGVGGCTGVDLLGLEVPGVLGHAGNARKVGSPGDSGGDTRRNEGRGAGALEWPYDTESSGDRGQHGDRGGDRPPLPGARLGRRRRRSPPGPARGARRGDRLRLRRRGPHRRRGRRPPRRRGRRGRPARDAREQRRRCARARERGGRQRRGLAVDVRGERDRHEAGDVRPAATAAGRGAGVGLARTSSPSRRSPGTSPTRAAAGTTRRSSPSTHSSGCCVSSSTASPSA